MNVEYQMMNWKNFLEGKVDSAEDLQAYIKYIERIFDGGFPVIFNLKHLSDLLGIQFSYLCAMIGSSKSFYREFSIPKRNGGKRLISAPYPSLLYCQRWISNNILSKIPIHESTHGFVPNRSIVTNAKTHLGCKWLLKLDIKDFFPSIDIKLVVWIFKQCGYARDVSFFLACLCTLNEKLPQGSAASPLLSNVAFKIVDKRLYRLAECWELKYTRYADDLTFSGQYIPSKFIKIVYEILQSANFKPNKEKTRLIGPKGRKIVTGISISSGNLKLPKPTKRQLRKELHYLWRMGFEHHTKQLGIYDPLYAERLLGKLAFWFQVEPDNQYVARSLNNIQGIRAKLNGLV